MKCADLLKAIKVNMRVKFIKNKIALPKLLRDYSCGDTNLANLLQNFYSDFTKNKNM